MRRFALLGILTFALVAAAVPVFGATPGLKAGESVRWTGVAPGFGQIGQNDQMLARYGEAPGCNPVTCSRREIQVADRGDLFVTATDGAGEIEVDVFRPDGTFVAHVGQAGAATVAKLAGVEPGRYQVQVTTNQTLERGGRFTATALLRR